MAGGETNKTGYLSLSSVDSDNNLLSGVTFGIYSDGDCTEAVSDLITIEDEAIIVKLDVGIYYVQVVGVPENYKLDNTVYSIEIKENEIYELTVCVEIATGYLSLNSVSANNSNVSGAIFGIYSDESCTKVVDSVTTASGAIIIELPVGTYYIKQTSTPSGYILNEEVISVTIVENVTTELTITIAEIVTANGTLIINGNLSTDLVVCGNLQVSGTISGKATASGSIKYGSLTGTATANATLGSCDILVKDGTLTFASAVSKSGGALYTIGTITNASGTTSSLYSDLTISTSSSYALDNSNSESTFIVEKGATAKFSASTRGVNNTNSSTLTVNGTLEAIATNMSDSSTRGIYNNDATVTIGSSGVVESTGFRGLANNTDATCTVNGTLITTGDVNTELSYGMLNGSSGTFTVKNGGVVKATGYRGILNNNGGIFVIENGGSVEASGYRGVDQESSSDLTVSGSLTATATGSDYNSIGIINNDSPTLTIETNGIVNATGYVGMWVQNSSSIIVRGTLTTTGTGTKDMGYGIANAYSSVFTVESTGVVDASGYSGIVNRDESTFTVAGTTTATATGTGSDAYGVRISSGTFTVSGTLYIFANSDSMCIYGSITKSGSGKVYANNVSQ